MNEYIEEMLHENVRQEESLGMGALLACGIGVLNACTYLTRGNVFASSQAGNLLYLGLDLAAGDLSKWPKYLAPVLMFAAGVILAEHYHKKEQSFHGSWRKIIMVFEIVLIFLGSLLPAGWNVPATLLFSLVCGLQSIAFRRFHHVSIPTITINGNFRDAAQMLTKYVQFHQNEDLAKAILYILIIFSYLAGIVAGALAVRVWGRYASLGSALILCIALGLIVCEEHRGSVNPKKL